VPPPTVLLDLGSTLNIIDNKYVTSHHQPTTAMPNEIRIVMADGRISPASLICTLAMNFSGFSAVYVLDGNYHSSIIFSLRTRHFFLKNYNPVIY
jgi:hypothetical protein